MSRRASPRSASNPDICLVARLAITALLAVAVPAPAHDGVVHDLVLARGQWWDGAKFVARDRVWVVAGALRFTAPAVAIPDTVDLAGRFVIPPLADAHTHHLSDTAGFARSLRGLLGAGILFARNPNNPASRVAAVRAALARAGGLEMQFANGGITSPGGHPVQIYERDGAAGGRALANDAYVEAATAADLDRAWPGVLAAKPDLIKVYLETSEHYAERASDPAYFGRRGLDPALLADVVRRARAAKLDVAAHVTSAADFRAAVAAGVKEIAHLPLAPLSRDDARAAARAGVTVVTTVVSHRPAPAGADLDALHRDNLRLLRAAGVRIVLGTDHPLHTVADEAAALVRLGAATPAEALALLGATPRYLAPDRRLGLSDGDEATYVVLEADPLADLAHLKRVAWSVKRGERVSLPVLPATKPAVADSMAPFLMRGDLAGALAFHERARTTRASEFDLGEQQLNALGYRMLQHGAVQGAVAILARNAELFPESPNVWDSLADAHLAAKDTAAARADFERVLKALPGATRYSPEQRERMGQRAREFLGEAARRP